MTVVVMTKIFKKLKPGAINHRSYKHRSNKSNEAYEESPLHELSKGFEIEVFINNDDGLQKFCDININVLNRHALRKRKHDRGAQMSFITKGLSKAIMKSL